MPFKTHARAVRAATALLTRFPVGGFPYSDDELRWSAAYLPVAGAAIGAGLAALACAVARGGALLAAAIVVVASLVVTGALHEDGLADTADALGGGGTRERVLAILKDSRVGAFGAAAIASSLILRVAALASLDAAAPWALVLVESASRAAPALLLAALPYVTAAEASKSRAIARAGAPQAAIAVASTAVVAALVGAQRVLAPIEIGAALGAALLATVLAGARFHARVGGVTGDFLGAAQQLAECAALVLVAIVRGNNGVSSSH